MTLTKQLTLVLAMTCVCNSELSGMRVDPTTGNSVTWLHTRSAATPGDPRAMSVVVINNAAAALTKRSDAIGTGGGAYESAPADTIAKYGSPGAYNYGWKLVTDTGTRAANNTVLYADTDTAAGSGAYAVIHVFSKDPALPGVFGVQVNSNAHVAKITLLSGLFGDQASTEGTTFVLIDPPTMHMAD